MKIFATALATMLVLLVACTRMMADSSSVDYETARWDPIHFSPAINTASNEQCLVCHEEILNRKPRDATPAGVKTQDTLAWYQTLDTYQGEQDTFHRRHLESAFAKQVMNMKCITCHQGNDPRDEAPVPPDTSRVDFTLRKMVNPNTCLMCHGKFNYQVMGLPSDWHESSEMFGNNCLTCHVAFRTNRHQVNFLNADEIEEAGKETADACYGCHGGRAWYRINFPYPRHKWPGMSPDIPEWAKDRPTESDARFLIAIPLAKSGASTKKE